jgi:hypothetical protein
MDFLYQDPYPILKDDTEYKKLTSDYVKVEQLGDREILVVDPKGLELLAQEASSFVPLHHILDDFRDEDTYKNVKDESAIYQKNPV